jgi:ParB family chromosome partitioning protein
VTKERRLGRGLEALLSRLPAKEGQPASPATIPFRSGGDTNASEPHAAEETAGQPVRAMHLSEFGQDAAVGDSAAQRVLTAVPQESGELPRIEISRIDRNPYQPRRDFQESDLQALADSLRAHGLLQPVVVRRMGDRYQLVAGERRLRAAGKAGWVDVPVQVVEADDQQMAELAIVENLQRKDLNALEKAAAFQRYLEQYDVTQEELAARLKLDRSTIANLIRLLELPEAVQEAVRQAKITQGHARALLPLGGEREQVAFAQRIQDEGLNVRQTEALVQDTIHTADAEPLSVIQKDGGAAPVRRAPNQHLAALEQEFRAALGVKVKITHNSRGRGKVVIPFASHEEFDRLREYICGVDEPSAEVG